MANERKIISLLMVFTCLETTLVETQTAKTENNNDFANIQSPSLIIDDGVTLNVADMLLTSDQPSALISNLVFQPKLLDFLQRPIGSVNSSQITLINKHDNQSVSLGSITSTGSASDFYSSYFEEKVIPPQGNSTFQIVFLPRQIGQMSGLFQIHTSFGMLR
jgi:Transmembrane protein 131-like N-terminal